MSCCLPANAESLQSFAHLQLAGLILRVCTNMWFQCCLAAFFIASENRTRPKEQLCLTGRLLSFFSEIARLVDVTNVPCERKHIVAYLVYSYPHAQTWKSMDPMQVCSIEWHHILCQKSKSFMVYCHVSCQMWANLLC